LELAYRAVARLLAPGLVLAALLSANGTARAWSPGDLFKPCEGDCAVTVYAGNYVQNSLGQVLVTSPETPLSWKYVTDDHIVATAVSRTTAYFWHHFTLEPEVGVAQRFGRQDATEVWGAFFFRYHGFPWDDRVLTTFALSTGLNWASEVTDVEQDRANDGKGSQLMHYFAPELTFAAPSRPNVELVLRMHHRSGVFGLVSDAWGGAQYATVGLRIRF
jgi:hypothetical protein